MLTNESQVRLTVTLRGRLASMGANSTSAKDRRKMYYILKAGKKWFSEYKEPTYHQARQSVTLNSETVRFWTSEVVPAGSRIPTNTWKKMSKMQRLTTNLQIQADYLAGFKGASYSFEIIN